MIALRAFLKRQRWRMLIVAFLASLCLVLAWTHSGHGTGHMAADEIGPIAAACMAVLHGGLGLFVGALAFAVARRRPPRSLAMPEAALTAAPPMASRSIRSRAGPAMLQVFLR